MKSSDYVNPDNAYSVPQVTSGLYTSINYNTDTGLDVVFDSFPGRVYTKTFCVCVSTPGVLRVWISVHVEVNVNTRLGIKSKTTSSPVSVL